MYKTEPIKRAQPRVIVFTTPTCEFCNATKNYLRQRGICYGGCP